MQASPFLPTGWVPPSDHANVSSSHLSSHTTLAKPTTLSVPPSRRPAPPSTSTLQRRHNSTPRPAASSTQRRIKRKLAEDPNHVPRPTNSFMLFRGDYSNTHRGKTGDETLSKLAVKAWRELSGEERARYAEMAEQAKREHAILYPGYVYCPKRAPPKPKSNRARRAAAKATPGSPPNMDEHIPVILLPTGGDSVQGGPSTFHRSSSVPTAPALILDTTVSSSLSVPSPWTCQSPSGWLPSQVSSPRSPYASPSPYTPDVPAGASAIMYGQPCEWTAAQVTDAASPAFDATIAEMAAPLPYDAYALDVAALAYAGSPVPSMPGLSPLSAVAAMPQTAHLFPSTHERHAASLSPLLMDMSAPATFSGASSPASAFGSLPTPVGYTAALGPGASIASMNMHAYGVGLGLGLGIEDVDELSMQTAAFFDPYAPQDMWAYAYDKNAFPQ